MTEELVEIHAIAHGTVQGVGFRATTRRIAAELKLKGSVRNLPDGTVEIYAQGTKSQIARFCELMNDRWQGYMQPLAPTFVRILNVYTKFTVEF